MASETDPIENVDLRASEAEIEKVRAVGLADLCEVASHSVVREAAATIHQIEFAHGGTARIQYDEAGTLLDVITEGCALALTPDGVLLLRSHSAD